jgi:hypothetical protein
LSPRVAPEASCFDTFLWGDLDGRELHIADLRAQEHYVTRTGDDAIVGEGQQLAKRL